MGPNNATYSVGRESSHSRCQILISAREDSVSREHLEITVTGDGRYYVNDLGSANGTFIRSGSSWERIRQTFIDPDAALRLGDYQTTVRKLLSSVAKSMPAPPAAVRHAPAAPPGKSRMVRCTCGTVKERGKPCPHCGT